MASTPAIASTSQTPTTQPAPDFTEEEICSFRMNRIIQGPTTRGLRYVFQQGLLKRGKLPSESSFDFYKRCGVDIKGLNKDQRHKVTQDFDGQTFDITLFYKCFREGDHGLASSNDDRWKADGNGSVESLFTAVKNIRNKVAHGHQYTRSELLHEADELRKTHKKILELCKDLYALTDESISREIDALDSEIERCLNGDFEPKSFEEYKQQVYYEAQTEFVKTKGSQELRDGFQKGSEHQVSPVNHIVDIEPLPLEEVYTEMKMEKRKSSQGNEPVSYETLLLDTNIQAETDSIIVINAQAGMGKTTLIKKITHDWKENKTVMKLLLEHDLILKTECRSKTASTIDELIKLLMPETSKSFKSVDFKNIIFGQKVMVILDGLDEANDVSGNLFQELLQLKKIFSFSLLITTRPEKIMYLKDQLNQLQLKMKPIQLLGVPLEKISDVCQNYFLAICKKVDNPPEVKILLDHLKDTEHILADLWKIPYNLVMMTILYVFGNEDIKSIKTSPRLHKEIHHLCIKKLKERLRLSETTSRLCDTDLDMVIKHFVRVLAKESLIALRDDNINIPKASYDQLHEVCIYHNVHIDEMASAFLQCLSTNSLTSEKIYGYPHKGTQDYFAALYFWLELTAPDEDYKVEKFMKNVVSIGKADGISDAAIENIRASIKKPADKSTTNWYGKFFKFMDRSSPLQKILKDVSIASRSDLSKYQNMFIHIIGMFFLENNIIKEEHKEEVLNLLKQTGMSERNQWIQLINSVECDDQVVSFIGRQKGILTDDVTIEDHSTNAYSQLLENWRPSTMSRRVNMEIILKGSMTSSRKNELLKVMKKCPHFNVRYLRLYDLFKGKQSVDLDLHFKNTLEHTLQRCCDSLTIYWGPMSPAVASHLLPGLRLENLNVNVSSTEHLALLSTAYNAAKKSLFLLLTLDLQSLDESSFDKLSPFDSEILLFIPDVSEANLHKAVDVAKRIMPRGGFSWLRFPRLTAPVHSVIKRFSEAGVKVRFEIGFPTNAKEHISMDIKDKFEAEIKCDAELDSW